MSIKKPCYQIYFLMAVALLYSSTAYTKKHEYKDACQAPKLTVVIVVDQFAHHVVQKLKPHFKYGLKKLLQEGIVYHQARHPHAVPETTPGHHALSTAVVPRDHGAVLNQWLNRKGVRTHYELDSSGKASVISPTGVYEEGKSPENTDVDGLSDQFMFHSTDECPHQVFALSLKSYPAISMANRKGKAFWIDQRTGFFTSSKAYCDQLPGWVRQFNKDKEIDKLTHCTWKTVFDKSSKAYKFPEIRNYDFAGFDFSMIDKIKIPLNKSIEKSHKNNKHKAAQPYEIFCKTPQSSKLLLSFAKRCIRRNLDKKNGKMLLWISLSNFDLLGHFYGPDSMEAIDLAYHIDRQLGDFLKTLDRYVGKGKSLVVLTADHGIAPFPELMKKRGFNAARRIMADDLMKRMNEHIKLKYRTGKIVAAYEPMHFRLNREIMNTLSLCQQDAIIDDLKKFLIQEPGIKNAWTAEDLKTKYYELRSLEQFYRNQVYRGRTGDIIVQPMPYVQVTHYAKGTAHMTPYDYDTHVPLIIYQKGRFYKGDVHNKVWMQQLPVTLAHIFGIPRPSASLFKILPGIE
jgi:predicted AlkP superfamily pyrophosphatase or phosphodiesterase